MIVSEMIERLQDCPPDAHVVATYESIFREIDVYEAPNGKVVIDADGNRYRGEILEGSLIPKAL